jgi:hypothetical protein
MAKKTVAQARSNETNPPASTKRSVKAGPAAVIREQRTKIEEAYQVAPPRASTERHPASDAAEAAGQARRRIGEIPVPMTLQEVCDVISYEIRADEFAPSAFAAIARDIEALSDLAEKVEGFEGFALLQGLAARTRLAGDVAKWLDTELTEMPEVRP